MKNNTRSGRGWLAWVPDSAFVACGGVVGTLSRHGVDVLMLPHLPPLSFPWATFLINICGAGLLGFVMAWLEEGASSPRWLRPLVAIGFCGGFTTFSTASVEILLLGRGGHAGIALSYLAASVIGGILVVTLTTAIGVRIFKKPDAVKGAAA